MSLTPLAPAAAWGRSGTGHFLTFCILVFQWENFCLPSSRSGLNSWLVRSWVHEQRLKKKRDIIAVFKYLKRWRKVRLSCHRGDEKRRWGQDTYFLLVILHNCINEGIECSGFVFGGFWWVRYCQSFMICSWSDRRRLLSENKPLFNEKKERSSLAPVIETSKRWSPPSFNPGNIAQKLGQTTFRGVAVFVCIS